MKSPLFLMFHDVIDDKCGISGFQTMGAIRYEMDLIQFLNLITISKSVSEGTVLTFDDGGISFFEVIFPVLKKYNYKAIFFISTKYIGTPGFLTKDQIKELHDNGHVIASHSHSHPQDISKLSDSERLKEWKISKQILEEIIGCTVDSASIPGGAVSKKVLDSMIEAGYTKLYTSEPTDKYTFRDGIKIFGRFAITKTTTSELMVKILTDAKTRRKLLIRYKLLRISKSLLGANYFRLKQSFLKQIK